MATIPAEVLGTIMDLSTYDVSCDLVDSRHGLLRFTHVSQLWRQTAIGLPSLWTNIQVEISHDRSYSTYLVDLIEEILDRSKNLPLSVDLSLTAYYYNEVSVRLLYLLLGESERWASFSATLDHHDYFLRLFPTLKSTPRSKSNHVTSLSLRMGIKTRLSNSTFPIFSAWRLPTPSSPLEEIFQSFANCFYMSISKREHRTSSITYCSLLPS